MKRLLVGSLMWWAMWSGTAWAVDPAVLEEIYIEIPRQYIVPVATETVAIRLLKGLNAVDKNLQIGDDRDKISLYYRGSLVRSIYKPESGRLADWVKTSQDVIELAVKKSPVAAKHDFEITELMLESAMKDFDEDSKYFGNKPTSVEKKNRHRRNFVARPESEMLYLKLRAFNNYSSQSIQDALAEYPQAKGIILDLRGSPGGVLSEAVKIAGLFLDEGIVAEVRSRDDTIYYNAENRDITAGKPMVVLTDGLTASSAEVVAVALQDQGRAKVVGTNTFGKGTVQNLISLSDGTTIALTHALFYTPSQRKLDRQGVAPDICTFEMPETKNIDNLLKMDHHRFCPAEKREDQSLDIAVAVEILKRANP